MMSHIRASLLILIVTDIFLLPACRGVSLGVAASPLTYAPWQQPCGGANDVIRVPADLLNLQSLNSPPLQEDNQALFAAELHDLIKISQSVVDEIQNFMRAKHFGLNSSHVTYLRNLAVLPGLEILREEDPLGVDDASLRRLYEGLVRGTIYLETIRHDLEADDQSTELKQRMHVLAHGGWIDAKLKEAGIYQVLCRLYLYLSAQGAQPSTRTVSADLVPHMLRAPGNIAARHNRDFTVMEHFKRLLDTAQQGISDKLGKSAPYRDVLSFPAM